MFVVIITGSVLRSVVGKKIIARRGFSFGEQQRAVCMKMCSRSKDLLDKCGTAGF